MVSSFFNSFMILSTSFFSTPEISLTLVAFKGSSEFLNASITLSLSDSLSPF